MLDGEERKEVGHQIGAPADFLRREALDVESFTTELASKARALGERDWRVAAVGHGGVWADRHQLTQAVMNLFDNAVRHSGSGGPIKLGTAVPGDEVRLWVRDHGVGVAPEDHERIFGRFARRHDEQPKAGTAGLGLAMPSDRRGARGSGGGRQPTWLRRDLHHHHPVVAVNKGGSGAEDPHRRRRAPHRLVPREGLRANGFTTTVVDDGQRW